MPLRSVMMKRFILGFQRRVWCPKWTPLSRSWRMVTTAICFFPVVSAHAEARELFSVRCRGPVPKTGVTCPDARAGPDPPEWDRGPSPAWLRLDQEVGTARKRACEVNPYGLLPALYPGVGGVVETRPHAPGRSTCASWRAHPPTRPAGSTAGRSPVAGTTARQHRVGMRLLGFLLAT